MKHLKLNIAIFTAIALLITSFGIATAQDPAYNTQFVTSITYQNVGTGTATIQFQFYNEKSDTPITVTRTLNAGASDSMFVGGLTGDEALPSNFLGSAVMGSDQPIVATLVQIPQSTTVRNRPLSNGFSNATSNVLLATVLKNQFNTTSKFSIQNTESVPVDVTLQIFDAANPGSPLTTLTETNIPAGAAKYYDMGTLPGLPASLNGSAIVTAVRSGTSTPANIVGSVLELSTNSVQATAFEGVSAGANTVYVATALCQLSGTNASTAYAVQNVGTSAASVTVTYSPGGATDTKTIQPGAKASFLACDKNPVNYSGAATVTSSQPIVVIAKAFAAPSFSTAFLGEASGASTLALPYVRYTSDANFATGTRQRAFIAIQNVGSSTVNNVVVEYRDKLGNLIGTHTISSIDPGAKANSNATLASGDTAKLLEFGNPEANPGGGFGGGAIIKGPAGSQLIAVVRIQTAVPGSGSVAEDYNGIPIQ
ncbi:hypothetical protein FKZ61_015895 [Litorilinea aerophila]|uniref:CARDB domain-containing protein n=1 Tax=Litorilinea aerophila TaxID=1204385 RepID=A0A540VDF2_9CHLR|nr:hypothetical protein [Litorilinea aerophila]MCC9077584.1 hypothetical protein [Litorilinea aerophila]